MILRWLQKSKIARPRPLPSSLLLKRNLCGRTATFPEIKFVMASNCLTAARSGQHRWTILCGFDPTCGLKHTECEMTYLSNVVERRPMLRVSGEILLAFCLATPLVLLLCFLV